MADPASPPFNMNTGRHWLWMWDIFWLTRFMVPLVTVRPTFEQPASAAESKKSAGSRTRAADDAAGGDRVEVA
jgi:hypothetical protein